MINMNMNVKLAFSSEDVKLETWKDFDWWNNVMIYILLLAFNACDNENSWQTAIHHGIDANPPYNIVVVQLSTEV